jgi:SAM-dependent methyltransferase
MTTAGPSPDASPIERPPLPPEDLRVLVGRPEADAFDNPTGGLVFDFPADAYERVLDFGCGCGRIARQLMQQRVPPGEYRGLDAHRGMVEWCAAQLTPLAPQFAFTHHDVASPRLNPGPEKPLTMPLPVPDGWATLAVAISVFTHLTEDQVDHYLSELARCLDARGTMHTTWFLFDKTGFPMMQDFQNALYINPVDPTNAVIYDRKWLLEAISGRGLKLVRAEPPEMRGFHWWLSFARASDPRPRVELPEDLAPPGSWTASWLAPVADR